MVYIFQVIMVQHGHLDQTFQHFIMERLTKNYI